MPRSNSAKTDAAPTPNSGDDGNAKIPYERTPLRPRSHPTPLRHWPARRQETTIAFAQLYSLHKRRIYSLCLRMVGNAAEAEDLTQEAFLQLHRKIATFRGDSAFSTWLHRLAINVVLMHLRKKGLPHDLAGRSHGACPR